MSQLLLVLAAVSNLNIYLRRINQCPGMCMALETAEVSEGMGAIKVELRQEAGGCDQPNTTLVHDRVPQMPLIQLEWHLKEAKSSCAVSFWL